MGKVIAAEIKKFKEMVELFKQVAARVEWPPELEAALKPVLGDDWAALTLMAICSRETRFGLILPKPESDGPEDKGDAGHGLGLMQIDIGSSPEFLKENWWVPEVNINKAVEVLQGKYNFLADYFDLFKEDFIALWWGAVAAYNCGEGNVKQALEKGRGVDYYTTGRDYSYDVKGRALYLATVI